jgi:regulator of protease activity HflC (stomatin/prohibitin superfamily)
MATYTISGDHKGKLEKLGALLIVLLILLVLGSSFGTVGAGERGIKLRFNALTGTVLGEGLYFVIPFIERVVIIDIKVQKEEADAQAASKDLQTVTSRIALNYSIDPAHAISLYQNIGIDYKSRVVDPTIQEAVKATTAKFTAEELITKREEVRDAIKGLLIEKLSDTGLKVEQLSIINFDFSESFNNAIEAKVTAEQNALAAKNKLDQVKYEAEQAIAEAKGKASALQIEAEAINTNPRIIELRAIEKWDGKLPQVTGGATPFININK